MTTATLTLTEFLLARIAEDEVRSTLTSWGWHDYDCETIPNADGYSYPCDCGVPERMKREAEAKRRIVAGLTAVLGQSRHREQRQNAEATLSHLAAVYAGHPDYRDEWRP